MSTYLYLECLDHNPPLRAVEESGQHLYDLPQIRADVANRDTIIAALELNIVSDEPFRSTTAWFLANHPHCQLAIRDERGETYPLEET